MVESPKTALATEVRYPYQGLHDTNFNAHACSERFAQLNDDLLIRLVSKGPVAIAINADFMGGYGSGVYRGPCSPHVDHAVLLTDWGTDAQTGVPF
ncbi:unnamed protein product [Adineta ricciae]|uniref:Peptidase C1A papain C-terminal domain-containing protein n=1 Tax=Adineta ricciae TaxID=249248 RepID=A0A814FML8_ADIRI|nr:unnamed protein product [Adineta ricciae]